MRGLITDCSNQSVHIVADAARPEDGSSTLLINAGVKYGNKREDFTIPGWALPGRPGHRGFPDKPDIVLIRNWAEGQPPPTNKKRDPNYTGPVVTFTVVEHTMSHDLYLTDACNEKRSIYVELVLELLTAGWEVELCTQVTDPTTWYRKHRVFEDPDDEDVPAAGPAVDAAAHDDSDVESSPSEVTMTLTLITTHIAHSRCRMSRGSPARARSHARATSR
jgi:hypothetical protein